MAKEFEPNHTTGSDNLELPLAGRVAEFERASRNYTILSI